MWQGLVEKTLERPIPTLYASLLIYVLPEISKFFYFTLATTISGLK